MMAARRGSMGRLRSGVSVLLAAAFATGVYADILLADKGRSDAVIAHNGFERQARDLQAYLKQITGAEIPFGPQAANRPAIILQLVEKVPGASDRPTAKQAYRIHTDGNRLFLTAATELGLTYAVWGLLEDHLGCRFYSYAAKPFSKYLGPKFEVVPQLKRLCIGRIDDLQEPAFQLRGFVYYLSLGEWLFKNRGGGLPVAPHGGAVCGTHNFYHFADPKTYFDKHPEWYPLRGGKRQHDWAMGLCGTNQELAREMAKNLMEKQMAKWKDPTLPIPLGQGDGYTGCQCPDCRELVEKEGTEAAPLLLLLNRILDITTKSYPNHQIVTFSYFETLIPPRTMKPHPNLWFNIVSSSLSQNHAGDQVGFIRGNPANRDYQRAIEGWPKLAPGRVTIWDWALTSNPLVEWPNIFFLPDNVRLWHESGVTGVALQVCWGTSNWNWLRNWLFLKLAWDPRADAEKLVRQFLRDYYGPRAAGYLWDYLLLTKQAYEDARDGYVPSGVRWTYWPQNMRAKMYPPDILEKMDALMALAQRAAARERDPIFAEHVAEARATSVDLLMLDQARYAEPFKPVKSRDDGQRWLVPGGRADLPARIRRICATYAIGDNSEHGPERETAWFVASHGGPIASLKNAHYAVDVVPNLRGQITSMVHLPTRKEILAADGAEFGYRDLFERISSQIWSLAAGDAAKVETSLVLSPPHWGFTKANRMPRTIALTPDGAGIVISRRYEQDRGGALPDKTRFTTRWMFHLPEPAAARVAVRGGGIERMLDLRHVQPGGVRGEKVGERLPGADFMHQRFDDVVAVSDAETVSTPIPKPEGEVAIRLDRGDGLLVTLTVPAAGWERIDLQPVAEKRRLTVTLVGMPLTMDKEPKTIELPAQTVRVAEAHIRSAAVSPSPSGKDQRPEGRTANSIKLTGEGQAVNERDGAEMVWVPAGEFLRGSKKGEGAADERPQRKVYLDGFWIYKLPVTFKQYKVFCEKTNREMPPLAWGQSMRADEKADEGSYPMLVNWHEAAAYAKWAGGTLPTEAQWEKAARGTDGRIYPWGNAWDPERAVGMERTHYRHRAGMLPVGSSPKGASPYGVEDMAGNVWEWVADWYDYRYYEKASTRNPLGPEVGSHKVLRGGDSMWDERFARCAVRMAMPPHVRDWVKTGFRVAIPATP